MFQPLHTGSLGLIMQQRNIDVIGNNVANVNTDGFKKSRYDFQDTLYTRMFNKVDNSEYMNLQRGTGTREYQTIKLFEQGAMRSTDRLLDVMLEGKGFFAVENSNPQAEDGSDTYLYTRTGNFYISMVEGSPYLVDANGSFVLNENMERIIVEDPANLAISPDGTLSVTNGEGITDILTKLAVVNFVNPAGMSSVGQNYYALTENTGEGIEPEANVRQGYLESSNVDYAQEVVRLIRAQRAYQIAARCVTTADQMLGVANQLRA